MRYPRDEGSGHQRLDLILFLGALALSAILAALPARQQTAVADLLRRSVLRPFVGVHQWAERRAELRSRLDRLQRVNTRLEKRLLRREGVSRENRALRDLLSLGLRRDGEYVSADLAVGTPRLSRQGRFLVDVGRADGVTPPAGVVVARGIVGVLRTARAERGYGDLWTHTDFRVSVSTDSGSTTGIVRPVDLEGRGKAMLFEGAPYQRRIPEGTLLVTTGAGGVFPPGVPVGTVRSVSSVESGWARSYLVEPAVRPGTARSVLVWRRPGGGGATGEAAGRTDAPGPPGADSAARATPRTPGAGTDSAAEVDSTVEPALETVEDADSAAAPAPADSSGVDVPGQEGRDR